VVRPARRPIAIAPCTVGDLRKEFLASCKAKNLSDRTVEGTRTRPSGSCGGARKPA
jgi:hypothetical protein